VSRTILIMAGGTGGHIFGSGVTLASQTSASTEKVAALHRKDAAA
jgi:UDP-N-acetylglucosamine:LPS N-acetylglucosamine transferase